MNDIQLDVTLSVVGPRQGLLKQQMWPMALRVVAGFGHNPSTEAERRALVTASLPWNLWAAALPNIEIVDSKGNRTNYPTIAPLEDNKAFLQLVKDSVEQRGHELCEQIETLDFKCARGALRDVEDVADKPVGVSWPGLLSTVSNLCQPSPSALRATWFFMLDLDKVCQKDPVTGAWQLQGATISAAPAQLNGVPISVVHVDADLATFEYTGDMRAYGNVLALDSALDHGLDELDNYWLTIRDSRDDSLLDLASQLDAALTPSAMLGALKIDELEQYCQFVGSSSVRPSTAGELAQTLEMWRAVVGKADPERSVQARKAVIKETLETPGAAADALRDRYQAHAIRLLRDLLNGAATPVQVEPSRWTKVGELLTVRLLPRAFQTPEPGPSKTGEGVTLVVGDERLRLVHESQTLSPSVDDVAAVQLWGRRSTDPSDLALDATAPATWHALTAGRYELAGQPAHPGVDRVFGCTAAYVDEVLYREYPFLGANMVCRNPLERAHREQVGDGEAGLMLVKLDRVAAGAWDLLAVPLRYGDHYEFAASVIDRAGGQAAELTEPGMPWQAKLTSIAKLDPPQRDRVHFLRRVPVGQCNLQPVGVGWPQLPDDVVLRCLESEPRSLGKQATVVLLVPNDPAHYLPPNLVGQTASGWPTEVRFTVEPPQTDEYTVTRWYMPPTNVPRASIEVALRQLDDVLSDVLARREIGLNDKSNSAPGMVMDPAITSIGIRWQVEGTGLPEKVALPPVRREFVVRIGDTTGFDGDRTFTVAPGTYLRVGILPLVDTADFERLDAEALADMLEKKPWEEADGRVFRAFEEDVLFVECATHAMPDLDASLLGISPTATGDVDISYAFSQATASARAAFRHVHQMVLSSRRWTWRNLPVPPREPAKIPQGTDEWRRRLASGPPRELFDPVKCDSTSEIVDYFDVVSEVDTGFVGRPDIKGTFLREAMNPAILPQAMDATVLFRDPREGTTAADYLQYHWTVRSRYAGVLKFPERTTPSPRRVAIGFRGDATRIKPPRVLAVMPLLGRMPASPRTQAQGDATPFLVVLDETWYREYGLGERLSARIAKVKQEIGEPQSDALRYGPIPDHNVDPSVARALDKKAAELDCFGPFGFTLDRGDSQALANATGFVIYPPPQTPAHYNLFVEFERWLDLPSGTLDSSGVQRPLRSATTEALPMYTLPDSAELWPDARESDDQALVLTAQGGGRFEYDASKLELVPFRGAHGAVMNQYRYLLIAGNMVNDGGRAVDVFLPARALWLEEGKARVLGDAGGGLTKCTHAVVAEILLNGRYDPKQNEAHPLSDADGLADVLKRMLPNSVRTDAPGMFRRFSEVGKVGFQ